MITLEEYIGPHYASPDLTPERIANAVRLLASCSELERVMRIYGVEFPASPVTHCGVSGQTLGGFRPQSCTIGAPRSNHKEGLAVDRYDPKGHIDAWCTANLGKLEECGIWLESPTKTQGWSHWQCVGPKSGRRVFLP